MFCERKSFKASMYGSFAPKRTLLARFWMTLAINKSPRRSSLEGGVLTSPSASGATIAGQKNLKNMNDPTAVYFASSNLGVTAADIFKLLAAGSRVGVEGQRLDSLYYKSS